MSDPPFSLSVCGIVVMYFKKSTISCPIYHSIYYIILIKHFYSSKNLLKKPPCASYMDSSWKWASGQLRVKGREGGAESETGKIFSPGFLSLNQKWGFALLTSFTHRCFHRKQMERDWVCHLLHTQQETEPCVWKRLSAPVLLLCEASLIHDGQKGIDFLEKKCFPGNSMEVLHLGVTSIHSNEI